jgi:hypothetical protein
MARGGTGISKLLSEFALVCLIVNVLVLQQRAQRLMPEA